RSPTASIRGTPSRRGWWTCASVTAARSRKKPARPRRLPRRCRCPWRQWHRQANRRRRAGWRWHWALAWRSLCSSPERWDCSSTSIAAARSRRRRRWPWTTTRNPDMDAQTVIVDTRRWIATMVIGLNLCPFARRVFEADTIRYVVSEAADEARLLDELTAELK